jgi:hypothetical protein
MVTTSTGNVTSQALSAVSGTVGNLYVPGTITGGVFSGTLIAGNTGIDYRYYFAVIDCNRQYRTLTVILQQRVTHI